MRRLRWPDSTNSVSEKPGTIQIDYCETLGVQRPVTDRSVDVRWHQETVARFKSEAAFLLTETDEREHAEGRPSRAAPELQASAHAGPFKPTAIPSSFRTGSRDIARGSSIGV